MENGKFYNVGDHQTGSPYNGNFYNGGHQTGSPYNGKFYDVGGHQTGSTAGSEPTGGISESAGEPGNHGSSLDETDSETTRYLAAATQLDLPYARAVVNQIIGEPFRAVAPAAGADVVVVTRWALAALRRRAQREVLLTCLLVSGVAIAVGTWTLIPIAVMAVLAIFVVAYERWVRDVKIIARKMLRGRFCAQDALSSPSQRIEKRLARNIFMIISSSM
jgi:hypothetical protein